MPATPVDVAILYPTDPLGNIIGGVESFIRGVIRTAPDDIRYHVFGATTDPQARPVGDWQDCELEGRRFHHFPLIPIARPGWQPKVPATLSYTLALRRQRPNLDRFHVLETHRIEHFLFMKRAGHQLNLFMHQNMNVLRDPQCDIRWKHAPWLYYRLERKVLADTASVFCVRQDAVVAYRERYPRWRERFHFLPTWTDPERFFAVDETQRQDLRRRLLADRNLPQDALILVNVGRLDHQKAPLLMVQAMQRVVRAEPRARLLWVGDGVLREQVAAAAAKAGIADRLILAGLMEPQQIADLHRAADLFVLSSAYEGMPIAVIEALACGLPVVSTRVGEVPRLVTPGVNGDLCPAGDAHALATAVTDALARREALRGVPCTRAAAPYTPQQVLTPLYETYRRLAGSSG